MKLGLIICAFGLVSCSPFDSPIESKVVEIQFSRPQEIRIIGKNDEATKRKSRQENLPENRTCSGAFVSSNGDIITARHCIDQVESLHVETYDGQRYSVRITAISARHDLALLHIDRRNTPYFRLASRVRRGERISILGSPLSITNVLSRGFIAKIQGDILHVDCSALPGNSGGPVFNRKGELVGIVTSGFIVYAGTTHLNSAQGPDSLFYFLREALGGYYGR